MILTPSIYNDFFGNVFDDFGGMFKHVANPSSTSGYGISTDVQEFDDHYLLDMELPGYNKEDIKAELKDGYLTISAKHNEEKNEKDKDGKYIRRERFYGQCSRSFFVGKNVTKEQIHASFENGVLQLNVPKVTEAPKVESDNFIAIEG
ncbi:MAG: Hsp20/alpha crystallin family protein [Wujia sp.]